MACDMANPMAYDVSMGSNGYRSTKRAFMRRVWCCECTHIDETIERIAVIDIEYLKSTEICHAARSLRSNGYRTARKTYMHRLQGCKYDRVDGDRDESMYV